jgi:hypothetical protein
MDATSQPIQKGFVGFTPGDYFGLARQMSRSETLQPMIGACGRSTSVDRKFNQQLGDHH